MSPLSTLLKDIRLGLGLSQVEFANALNRKGPYISGVETGTRYAPVLENVESELKKLGLSDMQMKRLRAAEHMSPREIKIPSNSSQECFIYASKLQGSLEWLEGEDYTKLTAYLAALICKRTGEEQSEP